MNKKAIIIGAGPAGLIAAHALLQRTDIVPVILEEAGITAVEPDMMSQQECYIHYNNKLFTYPAQLSFGMLRKAGISTGLRIIFSYLKSQLFPRKKIKTLEDLMINRYGKSLYTSFYKDYIEKLYGAPCQEIPSAWGIPPMDSTTIKPSLMSQITAMGGKVLLHHCTKEINMQDENITSIIAINNITEEAVTIQGDYFISTIPLQDLVTDMNGQTPAEVKEVAAGLQYRNLVTVSILLKKLSFQDKATGEWKPLELQNTIICIAGKKIKAGHIQVTHSTEDSIWVNMEYYCSQSDSFWKLCDEEVQQFAATELEKSGLACAANVLDATVTRTQKALAVYSHSCDQFSTIRNYMDRFKNLFLIGGNAMHTQNNIIHTTLTAATAVDNICKGVSEKENIWAVSLSLSQPLFECKTLKDFVFRDPANRWYLWTAIIAIIVQFTVFKYLYPFAGFINGDSYVYLETAYHNLDINTYPIGYSRFLRLFSVFTHSDTALIAFQYILLQSSLLSFVFTLFHFFKPPNLVKICLFVFMLFNPVLLYLSNYVSSDTLFLSLSLIWFTQLLWLLSKPTKRLIIWHGVVIFIAFTIRYNALWYPLIAALAFLLSKQPLRAKVTGLSLTILLIAGFILFTSNQYYKLTGIKQFSPFTGWQMANNAMCAYRFVDSSTRKPVPLRFKQLDGMIRTYFDTTRELLQHKEQLVMANTMYMWTRHLPLQRYMIMQFNKDSTATSLKKWATMAPLYADYGTYLITQYPLTFGEQYLWPNFIKYYAPPVEFLDAYNMGIDSVLPIAKTWFKYKTNKVHTRLKDFKVEVLGFYPVMTGTINVVFLFGLLSLIILGTFKQNPLLRNALLLVCSLWLINMGFSVFASPIALRFQLFPILVSTAFAFLMVGYLWKAANIKE